MTTRSIGLRRTLGACLAAAFLLIPAGPALAQTTTGTIVGAVVDKGEAALPGAAVRLVGREKVFVADERGAFRITNVPAGKQQLEVRYVGFETTTVSIDVAAEGVTEATVVLVPGQFVSEILTVRAAPLLEGQAKAFTQQKNAPNIINVVAKEEIAAFPD